jgi:hydroxypyruvate isomerase
MFQLAVCAEMVFRSLPFVERVRRIAGMGFQVEIWDWTKHDIDQLVGSGAPFSSMTGYVDGDLITADGAAALLRTAAQSIEVAARLGCPRLNLHGTGLDTRGLPVRPTPVVTGAMWLAAQRTLADIA